MTSPRLEGLPTEVLTMILRKVSGHRNGCPGRHKYGYVGPCYSLTNIALVSPILRGIVEPLIYARVSLKNPIELLKFLRSILRRPELAHLVRDFHVTGDSQYALTRYNSVGNIEYLPVFGEIFAEVAKDIQAHMKSSESSRSRDTVEWFQELKTGSWNSLVTTILMLLPRLRSLDCLQREGEYVTLDFRHVALGQLARTLVKVQLESWCLSTDQILTELARLATRDHIEEISLVLHTLYPADIATTNTVRYPAKRLDLRWSFHLDTQTFGVFLSQFPALQELRWRICEDPEDQNNDHLAEPPTDSINDVVQMLLMVKPQLRKLTMDPSFNYIINEGENGSIRSLAGFETLARLDIPAFEHWVIAPIRDQGLTDPAPVLGRRENTLHNHLTAMVNLLPESIERLSLRNCTRLTMFHVWDFLQSKGTRFHKLKNMDINLQNDYTYPRRTDRYGGSRSNDEPLQYEDQIVDIVEDINLLKELGLRHGITIHCKQDWYCRSYLRSFSDDMDILPLSEIALKWRGDT